MRWISSMNSTSPGTRLDSSAARSPACWMAGPLDMRSGRPLSCATIIASVVLPSPGGPASRMWSGVRCCIAAASSSSCSCPRTFCCPTNSASDARPQGALEGELGLGLGELGLDAGRRRRSRSTSSLTSCTRRARAARARGAAAPAPSRARRRSPRRRPRRRPAAATRSGQPRPTRAATTSALIDRAPGGAAVADAAARREQLAASETTMSFAVFGPMPDTLRNGASSSAATARRSRRASAWRARRAPTSGPTPETPRSRSNTSSSSRVAKPKRLRSSSRTMSAVCRLASGPTRSVSACCGVTCTARPTPPTSMTTTVAADGASTVPRTDEIICASLRSAASRLGGCATLAAPAWSSAPRRGLAYRTAAPPPRQAWQIASARASAASAGFGTASSRSTRATIAPTCALSAAP